MISYCVWNKVTRNVKTGKLDGMMDEVQINYICSSSLDIMSVMIVKFASSKKDLISQSTLDIETAYLILIILPILYTI